MRFHLLCMFTSFFGGLFLEQNEVWDIFTSAKCSARVGSRNPSPNDPITIDMVITKAEGFRKREITDPSNGTSWSEKGAISVLRHAQEYVTNTMAVSIVVGGREPNPQLLAGINFYNKRWTVVRTKLLRSTPDRALRSEFIWFLSQK